MTNGFDRDSYWAERCTTCLNPLYVGWVRSKTIYGVPCFVVRPDEKRHEIEFRCTEPVEAERYV